MNSGTAKRLSETEEVERAAAARFASELLRRQSPQAAITCVPAQVFAPTYALSTSTMGLISQHYGIQQLVDPLKPVVFEIEQPPSGVVVLEYGLAAAPDLGSAQVVQYGAYTEEDVLSALNAAQTLRGRLNALGVALPEDPVMEVRMRKRLSALDAVSAAFDDRPALADLKSRLTELIEVANEEYPETDIPHPEAITAFATFIVSLGVRVRPRLSLTPGGHVVAEWRDRGYRRAAFQFLSDRTVNFSARIPDVSKRGRPMPIYGSNGLAAVLERVAHDPAFSWVIGESNAGGVAANPG